MSRLSRIGRWILGVILIGPILVWFGLSVALRMSVLSDTPLDEIMTVVGRMLVANAQCAVFGCEPELLEGMVSVVFDDQLLQATPVALDIDERGRVLVAETSRQNSGTEDNRSHPYWLEDDLASRTVEDRRAYYRKWVEAGKFEDPDHFTAESDRLVLLEDLDADGVADKRTVMASWNEPASGLVSGVEAREGSIWVTSIPSLYRVEDVDYDGEAESVETLHEGFGVKTSLIGHDLHGLVWGPDGKLYFSMGDRSYHIETHEGHLLEPTLGPGRGAVFRMDPDGSDLEVFATGVRNPQELAFDDHGNLFTGDNNGDGGDAARLVYLVEGSETGWAMPYQTLAGDYVRGPWMAERLWELQHATQPAWVLPPVAYIANGPSGFVHYPGLGLPERYANFFFLCDYGYTPGRSGVWSFGVEPEGAGMKMVDRHKFAWSLLVTDVDFSWDGRIYASIYDTFGASQQVVTWYHPESRADPRIATLRETAARRMAELDRDTLLSLLSFPDQRLRLRAQYELAERGEQATLEAIVRDDTIALVTRLHALWGLGQQGGDAVRRLTAAGGDWLERQEDELRSQFARVAGDARLVEFAPRLRGWLRDDSVRVRFFAAQALGSIGDGAAVSDLFDVLRANADADVFLRHAAVWALHRIGDRGAVWARRDDESRAVRLGVLLVLRHTKDPRIEHFLADPDRLLVVEAARAIYDHPIDAAMPALAALADGLTPASADDLQTAQALHRRVIGANVRLRSEAGANALAAYVRDESQLESLREIALEALGDYTQPPPRDLTMGFYRPLRETEPEVLAGVLRSQGRALIDSSLGSRAMEIASERGELPLEDEELIEIIDLAEATEGDRVAALRALTSRARAGILAADPSVAVGAAARAAAPRVRTAGRDLELAVSPETGLAALVEAAGRGPDVVDRKHAWRRLGTSSSDLAREEIAHALDAWGAGTLDLPVALEVLEAAVAQGGALGERVAGLVAPPVVGDAEALVSGRRWALDGGDPEVGREIFQTFGDCQRCHGGGGGQGAEVGPDLSGVGERGARHVLESIVAPGARIAEGFGSVVVTKTDGTFVAGLLLRSDADGVRLDTGGEAAVDIPRAEIATQSDPTTGMPPMGLTLAPRPLRDVVTYVMSLE